MFQVNYRLSLQRYAFFYIHQKNAKKKQTHTGISAHGSSCQRDHKAGTVRVAGVKHDIAVQTAGKVESGDSDPYSVRSEGLPPAPPERSGKRNRRGIVVMSQRIFLLYGGTC